MIFFCFLFLPQLSKLPLKIILKSNSKKKKKLKGNHSMAVEGFVVLVILFFGGIVNISEVSC